MSIVSQISDTINKIQDAGCSTFFLTSSVLSITNGRKNKKTALANAKNDDVFKKYLQDCKEDYEDWKEAEERAFKKWLKHKQREYSRIEASAKLENDLAKQGMQMFFSDWPLQISIAAINQKRKSLAMDKNVYNVIIAKHSVDGAKDPLTILYPEIVDAVKASLSSFGIEGTNIYRFSEKNRVKGGAALANIYAMMSCMPTLVIMPSIDIKHKLLNITLACWNQDSIFPMQKRAFRIEYDPILFANDKEYYRNKINELTQVYITSSAVLNDTYRLSEGISDSTFLQNAINLLDFNKYPYLKDFARLEYSSIMKPQHSAYEQSSNNTLMIDELHDRRTSDSIKSSVNHILENL